MEVKESDVISYISFVLNRYNKEHKLLDQIGCDELIKSLIIYNELSDYIKDVKYIDSNDTNANMSYSYFTKLLDMFNIHDEIVSTNLDILHALLHEVMHAKQYKLLDNSNDEFIKTILIKSLSAASYEESEDKEKALEFAKASTDMKIYALMPSELNAEIEAFKQTKEIVNHLYLDGKYKYLNMFDLNIKLLEIRSYEKRLFKIVSPVEKFIKLRNKYLKDKIEIDRKTIMKYDLDTRLSYGLPLTKWEYSTLTNNIQEDIKSYVNSK